MTIYSQGKNIDITPIRHLISQGEKNIDYIDFVVEKLYNDIDISNCIFIMKAVNQEGTGFEQVLTSIPNDNNKIITLRWQVSEIFTAISGEVLLELRGVTSGENNIVIKYQLGKIIIHSSPTPSNVPSTDIIEESLNDIHNIIKDINNTANEVYQNTIIVENNINLLKTILENISPNESGIADISMITNYEYRCLNAVNQLTLSIANTPCDDFMATVVFTSGSSATVLTMPNDTFMINGDINIEANMRYTLMFFYDGIQLNCVWFGVDI